MEAPSTGDKMAPGGAAAAASDAKPLPTRVGYRKYDGGLFDIGMHYMFNYEEGAGKSKPFGFTFSEGVMIHMFGTKIHRQGKEADLMAQHVLEDFSAQMGNVHEAMDNLSRIREEMTPSGKKGTPKKAARKAVDAEDSGKGGCVALWNTSDENTLQGLIKNEDAIFVGVFRMEPNKAKEEGPPGGEGEVMIWPRMVARFKEGKRAVSFAQGSSNSDRLRTLQKKEDIISAADHATLARDKIREAAKEFAAFFTDKPAKAPPAKGAASAKAAPKDAAKEEAKKKGAKAEKEAKDKAAQLEKDKAARAEKKLKADKAAYASNTSPSSTAGDSDAGANGDAEKKGGARRKVSGAADKSPSKAKAPSKRPAPKESSEEDGAAATTPQTSVKKARRAYGRKTISVSAMTDGETVFDIIREALYAPTDGSMWMSSLPDRGWSAKIAKLRKTVSESKDKEGKAMVKAEVDASNAALVGLRESSVPLQELGKQEPNSVARMTIAEAATLPATKKFAAAARLLAETLEKMESSDAGRIAARASTACLVVTREELPADAEVACEIVADQDRRLKSVHAMYEKEWKDASAGLPSQIKAMQSSYQHLASVVKPAAAVGVLNEADTYLEDMLEAYKSVLPSGYTTESIIAGTKSKGSCSIM